MSTFDCSWEEFKQRAKEFHDAAPSLNHAELDNAYKCLGLSYLGMREDMWRHSASIVLSMMVKEYIAREVALDKEYYSVEV